MDVLRRCERIYGCEDRQTSLATIRYAQIKMRMGHLAEAARLFRRGITNLERKGGGQGAGLLQAKMYYAETLNGSKRQKEAQI